LKPGDQYPEASRYAMTLFNDELERLGRKGMRPEDGTPQWQALKAAFVPPYDVGKFPNKWRKMEADRPARTLLAHLGKDGYSHIHYDDRQARPISVREAARLQSFPDGFRFSGTMNPAFKQIGNAVPPLLAKAVAEALRRQLVGDVGKLPLFASGGRR
jgi:DNA (cytosine-5)-methyltransferase 1